MIKRKKSITNGNIPWQSPFNFYKLFTTDKTLTILSLYNSFNTWGWLDTLDKEILQDVEIVTGLTGNNLNPSSTGTSSSSGSY